MQKLEAFLKYKVVYLDKDDGKDNSSGEYWKFNDPNNVEY